MLGFERVTALCMGWLIVTSRRTPSVHMELMTQGSSVCPLEGEHAHGLSVGWSGWNGGHPQESAGAGGS
eukprot:2812790-Alexandrium_andersonii.AAC.1